MRAGDDDERRRAVRRRIYCDPGSGHLEDVTSNVYLFDDPREGRHKALYDDALWQRYLVAEAACSAIASEVVEALVNEPYDHVERELNQRMTKIMDERYDAVEAGVIESYALEHAAKVER